MATAQAQQTSLYELIDAATLAERWHVTERFIKEGSRASRNSDPIPCIRLHAYIVERSCTHGIARNWKRGCSGVKGNRGLTTRPARAEAFSPFRVLSGDGADARPKARFLSCRRCVFLHRMIARSKPC